MEKYSKLLVAYDGSDSAKNALRQAIGLAKRTSGAQVKSVTVMYTSETEVEFISAGMARNLLKDSADRLVAEAVEIGKAEGVTIDAVVKEGIPFEEITGLADEDGSDLIVMGRRGLKKLERILIGSVTSRVVGHTLRNVLVVPSAAVVGTEDILVATDGSDYSAAAVEKAIGIAAAYGGHLHGVSVVDIDMEVFAQAPDEVDRLAEHARLIQGNVACKAEAAGVKYDSRLLEGEVYSEIIVAAEDIKPGMIVLGTHGRTGLKRLLMGSNSERVIGHSSWPVLVVAA